MAAPEDNFPRRFPTLGWKKGQALNAYTFLGNGWACPTESLSHSGITTRLEELGETWASMTYWGMAVQGAGHPVLDRLRDLELGQGREASAGTIMVGQNTWTSPWSPSPHLWPPLSMMCG